VVQCSRVRFRENHHAGCSIKVARRYSDDSKVKRRSPSIRTRRFTSPNLPKLGSTEAGRGSIPKEDHATLRQTARHSD
jgi:hypothetical protein